MAPSTPHDPHNLQRFVDAQSPIYTQILSELRAGQKRTHWIWFIFPQLAGLGSSPTAARFAIASKAEAIAYLDHPILGPRLLECTALVNHIESRPIEQIFGEPDNLKFRSSMTLFAQSTSANQLFLAALERYFSGEPDPATLIRLSEDQAPKSILID